MSEETTQPIEWNPEAEAIEDDTPVVDKPRVRKPRVKKEKGAQVVFKNDREMRHDVFKADLQMFKKNTSYTKGMVTIVEHEHSHIYHTINSQCKSLRYSNAVGGHFHEVNVTEDAKGAIITKCGPPMRYGVRRLPNGGFKKTLETCKWYDGMNDKNIVDEHTHDMVYLHSEMINVNSAKKMRNIAAENQAEGFKDMDR